jgi:NADP-dependent 3-hydroxy acid dehydrogenase YdfG
MKETIAVVGAGPNIGYATARRFGQEGSNVALIARDVDRLAAFVDELTEGQIEAAAFPADVTDDDGLADALRRATERFGTIDVLEYSPMVDPSRPDALSTPRAMTLENGWHRFDLNIRGAITAVSSVLPGMLERRREPSCSCPRCFVRVRSPNSCGSCTALASATRRTRGTSKRSWRWLRRARSRSSVD